MPNLTMLTVALAAAAGMAGAQTADAPTTDPREPVYCVANVATGTSACAFHLSDVDSVKASIGVGSSVEARATASMTNLEAADVLVGQLYGEINYVGNPPFEMFGTQVCNTGSGMDWQLASLPNWINDETSSFRGYAGCKLEIWEDANFGGSHLGPQSSSSYVGAAMNDETSAVKGY